MAKDQPIRFVFFDVDDTLIDTTAAVDTAYDAGMAILSRRIREHGGNLPDGVVKEKLLDYFGSRLPQEFFAAWLWEAGLKGPDCRRWAADASAIYWSRVRDIEAFPETRPLLSWLDGRGIWCGLITDGRVERQMEKIDRAGLPSVFAPIIVSENYPLFEGKPGQAMFQDALAAVLFAPNQVMFVGDRPKDIIGGNLAGMITVRILQGWVNRRPTRNGLAVATPSYTVKNLGELHGIISRHGCNRE